MFKKFVLAVGVLLIATKMWAAPLLPLNVTETTHNLSASGYIAAVWGYNDANEDEVCIFCHTPHGGTLSTPLWNRDLPVVGNFTHYSSATLLNSTKTLDVQRPVNTESLLCMSCHDGAIAMNSIKNYSNDTGKPANGMTPVDLWYTTGARIGDYVNETGTALVKTGRTLSDDHPISLSYYDALGSPGGGLKLRALSAGTDPREKGVRFFGSDSELYLECSSCHNPHVNYNGVGGNSDYTPFLVMSNTGSNLCLACHIK